MEFRRSTNIKIVGISGDLGAGKSTLCKLLAEHAAEKAVPSHNAVSLEETLDDTMWEFYRSAPKNASEAFQTHMANNANNRVLSARNAGQLGATLGFVDQPPDVNHDVFARVNHNFGNLSTEYYEKTYKPYVAPHRDQCDLLVFLYARDAVTKARIKKRDRPHEDEDKDDGYDHEYMEALHESFFEFVVRQSASTSQRLLVLDWNEDWDNPPADYKAVGELTKNVKVANTYKRILEELQTSSGTIAKCTLDEVEQSALETGTDRSQYRAKVFELLVRGECDFPVRIAKRQ